MCLLVSDTFDVIDDVFLEGDTCLVVEQRMMLDTLGLLWWAAGDGTGAPGMAG